MNLQSLVCEKKLLFDDDAVCFLRCPKTKESLIYTNGELRTVSGSESYEINSQGIPLFAKRFISNDAKTQEAHYDKVSVDYLANLKYPHTQEYMKYLDQMFLDILDNKEIDCALEVCCGKGEAFSLLAGHLKKGIGVDVSICMLTEARKNFISDNFTFLQADAIHMPLADHSVSDVFILGGIHHVSKRQQLFNEIYRVLQPGGKFYWREPVSDFFLWRWIRFVIYRFSPHLDNETERPLLYHETVPLLEEAGFKCRHWKTFGLIGFCFFMNSDVLIFNRFFRFIPGIRGITRFFIRIDKLMIRIPFLKKIGLQVVGFAEKNTTMNSVPPTSLGA